jgi:hypothetical protein
MPETHPPEDPTVTTPPPAEPASAGVSNPPDPPPHEPPDPEKLVPVGEAIRYRKRAQTAEQQLDAIQQRYDQLQQQLDASQQTITSLERRQKIDMFIIVIIRKKRRECRSTSRRLPGAKWLKGFYLSWYLYTIVRMLIQLKKVCLCRLPLERLNHGS